VTKSGNVGTEIKVMNLKILLNILCKVIGLVGEKIIYITRVESKIKKNKSKLILKIE